MGSYNRVVIVGRVGADPIVKEFEGGGKVANFSIATDSGKDKRTGQTITDWHRCCAFSTEKQKVGAIVEQYVRKGMLILVSGSLRTRAWEKDGVKHSSTEIVVNEVQLLSPKSENQSAGGGAVSQTNIAYESGMPSSAIPSAGTSLVDDPIPF